MKCLKLLKVFLVMGCMVLSSVSLLSQNLVWADDFDGTTLDLTKWEAQIGDGCDEGICGWGNNELEYYKAENAVVSNGSLKIIAKLERVAAKKYTSARIRTKNLADFTYGRFEARIKLPVGKGLWPGFWMLSTTEPYGGWPQSGEIDIMEFLGSAPDHTFGTIHYGDPYPDNKWQGNNFYLNDGTIFSDKFHEFAIEWKKDEIRWYVDNILYSVKTAADVAPDNWPFDNDFHFILNTAVGGNLGGTVDDNCFPATMEIEYVRVYDAPKPTISGNRVVSNKAQGEKYTVYNTGSSTINWSVPAGATIAAGQGTSTVTVNFGDASGNVTATIGTQVLPIDVIVEPSYTKSFAFENFDEPANVSFYSSDGALTEVANPAPNTVNGSAISGKYIRNSQIQYDVLFYTTTAIPDASLYSKVAPDKRMYIDLYTNAPVGTELIVQLETSTATATNWPTGRHSRYTAKVAETGKWHRLPLIYFDKPDPAASVTISKVALLFAANTFTGDTYYFDNFDNYNAGTSSSNQAPTVSITSPSDGSSFAEGTSISIAASANDSDGSITKVDFFANGASIGTDNTSPYSVNWTVPLGTYSLTAIATDDAGATTTSSAVAVTGTSSGGGTATSIHVESVVTGTARAAAGAKYGTATITIYDNLGNPSSGALVTGDFSGTFTETKSGTTDSYGKVTLQTTGSARTVTVNFCVTDVSGSLPYDPAQNKVSCTKSGEIAMGIDNIVYNSITIYPIPVLDQLTVQTEGFDAKTTITIYNIAGAIVLELESTSPNNTLNVSNLSSGAYVLEIKDKQNLIKKLFIK